MTTIYETGTTAITYDWANVIGNTLDFGSGNSTSFFISDTDGNFTKVTGTGFTYNNAGTAPTGGTVTGLERSVNNALNGEQITNLSISATTFWALSGSAKIATALSGAAIFQLSQTQLSGSGGTYAVNGYAGGGIKELDEVGKTTDTLIFQIGATEQLVDQTTGKTIALSNINAFAGGSGTSIYDFTTQPVAGLFLQGNGGGTQELEMSFPVPAGQFATLDLTGDSLFDIGGFKFANSVTGTGINTTAGAYFYSNQFGAGGLSTTLSIVGDAAAVNDRLNITMSLADTSFDATGFTFDANWLAAAHDGVYIDGSTSSKNLTITGPAAASVLVGGSGDDTFVANAVGRSTIGGGGGFNVVNYSFASLGQTLGAYGFWTVTKPGSVSDTLVGIEVVHFSDKTVALRQVSGDDFTGSATSGILLQSGGNLIDWVMNNGAYSSYHSIGGASGYGVIGTGDANGDGKADLFLQNGGGSIIDWDLVNGSYAGYNSVGNANVSGYGVVGTGDFNCDGTADLLLENGSGNLIDWIIKNGTYSSYNSIGNTSGYGVIGTGDFNGDGTADVLLQNAGGSIIDWTVSNGVYSGYNSIGNANAAGYGVVGTGDFNGDGTADLLLENSTGNLIDWTMKNGAYSSYHAIGNTSGYSVVGTGDYATSGNSDILLQNSSGNVIDWMLSNGQYSSWNEVGGAGTYSAVNK
jgi:hypothetical protein